MIFFIFIFGKTVDKSLEKGGKKCGKLLFAVSFS